jgi:hypothetical protein
MAPVESTRSGLDVSRITAPNFFHEGIEGVSVAIEFIEDPVLVLDLTLHDCLPISIPHAGRSFGLPTQSFRTSMVSTQGH